jgi:hypothetical protein
MEFSGAGAIGAAVGLALGLLNYRMIVSIVEGRLRALDRSESAAEREVLERKLTLMRRIILWMDVVVFSLVGYTVGTLVAG